MKIIHAITTFFHVFVVFSILNSVISRACSIRKTDNYLVYLEYTTYIERKEKDPVIYRGISTTKGKALEQAFKELKKGLCPDLKGLK